MDIADPDTLVVIGTYKCTAACRQCCFESSPSVTGRLSREVIFERIEEAIASFPRLGVVVFTGGEVVLLRDDLFDAIAHASSRGLRSRVVSNGSWGSTDAGASRTAARFKAAGLTELNISTGLEHQEFVPRASVVRAAIAAARAGIRVLVTVEADTETSDCMAALTEDQDVLRARLDGVNVMIQSNSWMPFHENAEPRAKQIADEPANLRQGCDQVFAKVVVTPHDNLSACCGLTLEHIPEMRLGRNSGSNMAQLYKTQEQDLLKYWISLDGPYNIIEQSMGDDSAAVLRDVVHPCQACAILHQNPVVREAVTRKSEEVGRAVMTRFMFRKFSSEARARV